MPESSSATPKKEATLTIETLVGILGSLPALKILRVLADGRSLMSNEIAAETGLSSVSGQLARLRSAGVVIAPRIKLYEIAPQYLVDKTNRHLDFGVCLLRFGELGDSPGAAR
jgi:DNA-binding transcriptional ArsR family regulator